MDSGPSGSIRGHKQDRELSVPVGMGGLQKTEE